MLSHLIQDPFFEQLGTGSEHRLIISGPHTDHSRCTQFLQPVLIQLAIIFQSHSEPGNTSIQIFNVLLTADGLQHPFRQNRQFILTFFCIAGGFNFLPDLHHLPFLGWAG